MRFHSSQKPNNNNNFSNAKQSNNNTSKKIENATAKKAGESETKKQLGNMRKNTGQISELEDGSAARSGLTDSSPKPMLNSSIDTED